MKNLDLYHEDQCRRLTGKVIDIEKLNLPSKNDISISITTDDIKQSLTETNSDLDKFFKDSDLTPMTPESQSILDDMFSS